MRRVSYRHVGYSRSEKRRDRRYVEPSLQVSIRGADYKTVDFSLGGLRLRGIGRPETLGGEVELVFHGVRNGQRWSGQTMARMVNFDIQERQCGMAFVDLPDDAFVALEALMFGSRRQAQTAGVA